MIKACIIIEEKTVEKRVFPLYKRLTIGRASANDISLSDSTISKRHAALGRVKGHAVVKDLGSHNGTFVNGKQVEKAMLSSGDKLQIGRVNLRFVQDEETTDRSRTEDGKKFQKILGEYLVKADIIQEFTLLATLDNQKEDQTLGDILVSLGVANDEDIAMALAKQLNLPFVRLEGLEIQQEVLSLVPTGVSKINMLMPIKITEGKLQIAMVNPLDSDAIQVARMTTRMNIDVAVTPQGDLLGALGRYYAGEFLDQVLEGKPDLDDVTVEI